MNISSFVSLASLGRSVSLSALLVDDRSWEGVRDSLSWECDMVRLGKAATWSGEMCEVFDRCVFPAWERTWG